MNLSSADYDRSAREEAALWAARLDGSALEESDWAALDAWLAKDRAHRALLSEYCELSADLEVRLPALASAGAVAMRPRTAPEVPAWRPRTVLGVALAAAAVAIGLWLAMPGPRFEDIVTPAGQRQALTLADGTRLELSARTRFRIENSRSERRMRLAEGEVYLQVAQDPSRPFVVETPAGSIRVIGTVFDVCSEAAGTLEVTVVEGTVQVRPEGADGSAVRLGSGDQLSVQAGRVRVRPLSAGDLEDALAWRQGKIVFHGAPLEEALARFAYYHGCQITAAPEAAALRVGGVYSLDDLDGFFAALEEVLPVRVARDGTGPVRVSLRADR